MLARKNSTEMSTKTITSRLKIEKSCWKTVQVNSLCYKLPPQVIFLQYFKNRYTMSVVTWALRSKLNQKFTPVSEMEHHPRSSELECHQYFPQLIDTTQVHHIPKTSFAWITLREPRKNLGQLFFWKHISSKNQFFSLQSRLKCWMNPSWLTPPCRVSNLAFFSLSGLFQSKPAGCSNLNQKSLCWPSVKKTARIRPLFKRCWAVRTYCQNKFLTGVSVQN